MPCLSPKSIRHARTLRLTLNSLGRTPGQLKGFRAYKEAPPTLTICNALRSMSIKVESQPMPFNPPGKERIRALSRRYFGSQTPAPHPAQLHLSFFHRRNLVLCLGCS